MKIEEARITFLVGAESTTITLHDMKSGSAFAEIKLTPIQLSQALSRLSYTNCEINLFGLDKLNKR